MENLIGDVRHATRILFKNPGFTSIAVAALALGIGANTAIFTVVNAVLLQPLPYPQPDRIMRVARQFQTGRGDSTSIPKFMAWRQNQVFDSIAAYDFTGPGINIGSGDHPEQVKGIHVSSEYFRVFGVSPALGRTFTPQEDLPNAGKFTILSDSLWKNRFGADPRIAGKPVTLSGDLYTIVGVMPAGFQSEPVADILLPLQADPNSANQGHYLLCAARLKPGVTAEAARAQMKVVAEQFRKAHPKIVDPTETIAVVPLHEAIVGDVRLPLMILLGSVGFVLLIACANVANLLLARAAARQKEVAIRAAIGASRARIMRQHLTESVLLSITGGLLGYVLGAWGVRALLALNPGNIPGIGDATHTVSALNWPVLAFTFGVAFFTGILFGVFPAFQAARLDVNSILKEAGGRAGTGLKHNRARSVLVVSELTLAMILLVGAALMIRTFAGLRSVKPGFDPHNVITMSTSLLGGRYDSTALVENLVRQATQRIETLPGVDSATSAIMLPVEGGIDLPFVIPGQPPPKGNPFNGDEQWRAVSAHYFQVFRVPLLRGRAFDERDTGKSARVVVINDAMAKKYWPKEDPVGRQIEIGKGLGPQFEEPGRQIVGIVGNVREAGLSGEEQPVMYVPNGQVTDSLTQLANRVLPLSWAVRTSVPPGTMTAAIQREFLAVDPLMPVSRVRTMEQVMAESTARQNFNAVLLTIFAGIALLLAAIGIYGLMSYVVEQRTQEIGIRMALGAERGRMLALIVRQGMTVAVIGVALGLGAAFGLARLLSKLLFGVKANDPVTFASVAAILTIVAFIATYIPAWRATRIDPVIALRYE